MDKEYTDELKLDFGPDGNQLIPVVTQDAVTHKVLIVSFTNKEAFEQTIQSGYATYFSRSRNEVWKKGLTSGNFLQIHEIRINCEQNSLLYLVTPVGRGVCHARNSKGNSYSTCYYRRLTGENKLEFIDE
jgi:phosphoribosyl-AMP cyclohydrolase